MSTSQTADKYGINDQCVQGNSAASLIVYAHKANSQILRKLLTSTIVTNNIETVTNTSGNTDNVDDYSKRRNNRPLRITDDETKYFLPLKTPTHNADQQQTHNQQLLTLNTLNPFLSFPYSSEIAFFHQKTTGINRRFFQRLFR